MALFHGGTAIGWKATERLCEILTGWFHNGVMRLIMPILAWLCLLGTALPLTGAALAAPPPLYDATAAGQLNIACSDAKTKLPAGLKIHSC
jgi:hypothetical protein